jgi:hypothetical protein
LLFRRMDGFFITDLRLSNEFNRLLFFTIIVYYTITIYIFLLH